MNTIETDNTRLAMLADTAWPRWRGDRVQPWSVICCLAESTVLILLISCLLPWRGEWLAELPAQLAVAGILWLCVAWIVRRGIVSDHRQPGESPALQANEAVDQQLRAQTAQLLAANQELEAFACSVSHDLRAPLRAVDGFARILEEEHAAQLDEAGRRALGIIRDESQRMGRLISDLLEFSRVGRRELRRTEVDMATLVREQFQRLQEAGAGRDVEFRVNELPPVQADSALLGQVWSNLLDNALKYTRHTPRAEICIEGSKQGSEIIYSIRDNGAGFDMRHVGKLFGMFQRLHTTSEFEGTGVGLALAQRIIQRHGGRIWAAAQVGRGATFSFSLPAKVQGKAMAARLRKIPKRTAVANLKAPWPRANVPVQSPRWRFPFPAADRGD
jgi:signal transduction histidine kinase